MCLSLDFLPALIWLIFFFKGFFAWLCQVLVAARGLLSSCGAQAPEYVGSVICRTQAL